MGLNPSVQLGPQVVASKKDKMKKVKASLGDFPGGTGVKNPPANATDTGSSPGPGKCHMPQSN